MKVTASQSSNTSFPPRFDVKDGSFSKEAVQASLQKHGVILLTNLDVDDPNDKVNEWSTIAANVPNLVFHPKQLLLQQHRADAVHVEHEQINLHGHPLLPHSDGYVWGDCYPDLVLLICEQPAGNATTASTTTEENQDGSKSEDGANYVIDGYNVFARLKEETRTILETTLVDHTEYSDTSFVAGVKSIVPVLRYLKPRDADEGNDDSSPGWWAAASRQDGNGNLDARRLCWRRMIQKKHSYYKSDPKSETSPYISLWTPVKDEDAIKTASTTATPSETIEAALWELDRAIEQEGRISQRFTLQRGEALMVDNYRMLHAREGFLAANQRGRRMWRVWSWTAESMGLPPEMLPAKKHHNTKTTNDVTITTASTTKTTSSLPPAGIYEAAHTIQTNGKPAPQDPQLVQVA